MTLLPNPGYTTPDLEMPFDAAAAPLRAEPTLPATYQRNAAISINGRGHQITASGLQRVDEHVSGFFASELDVSRLNCIHKHLWLAGLERPARPLHQQIAIGRRVVLTEAADLHLLWKGDRVYLKPLPEFLLSSGFWQGWVRLNPELHERASGFLLSYLWLISHQSDLRLAQQHGLIPECIDWVQWTTFARSLSLHLDLKELNGINIRYRHGELRLDRVDAIYRLCSEARGLTTLFRGYHAGHYQYESFISSKLGWLVSIVAYVGLVLTAMQVGLGTDELRESEPFQRASYGFTVFAIMAPVIVVGLVLAYTAVLVLLNARYTLGRRRDWSGVRAKQYRHMSRGKNEEMKYLGEKGEMAGGKQSKSAV